MGPYFEGTISYNELWLRNYYLNKNEPQMTLPSYIREILFISSLITRPLKCLSDTSSSSSEDDIGESVMDIVDSSDEDYEVLDEGVAEDHSNSLIDVDDNKRCREMPSVDELAIEQINANNALYYNYIRFFSENNIKALALLYSKYSSRNDCLLEIAYCQELCRLTIMSLETERLYMVILKYL